MKKSLNAFVFNTALVISLFCSGTSARAQHDHHKPAPQPPAQQKPQQKPQQQPPQHQHEQHKQREQKPAEQPPPQPDTTQGQQGQQGQQGHQGHQGHQQGQGMPGMVSVTGGPYRSFLAMGSGTSIVPASSPGYMWHFTRGDWVLMLMGDLKFGLNYQSGPRGVGKAESQNNLMFMGSRKLGGGELMLRGMFSAEPLTAPHGGFPQLFQVGETYRGRAIIDAQHPHDLFMELAASYTYAVNDNVSVQFYGGPVAEPALGPPAFMHRASGFEIPIAPLGHHWQDSTHISHGVFTTGVSFWRFKLEGSVFNGREPDENRVTIDLAPFDSRSVRLWFTPTRNWSMQVSLGHLVEPEALEPGDTRRATASIHYNRRWRDNNWATSLIWGRNATDHGNSNTYLLESTVNFLTRNYLYTRIELADREGLLRENIFGRPGPLGVDDHHESAHADDAHGETEVNDFHRVAAFTFGGVRDIISSSKLILGVGADVTFYHQPRALKQVYGNSPVGMHFFVRLRPGRMRH